MEHWKSEGCGTHCGMHLHTDKWKVGLWGGEALRSTSGGKLVLYKQFKTTPELEPYVRAGVPLAARRILAGLQAGCLQLQIELGRFTCPKMPYEEHMQAVWSGGRRPNGATLYKVIDKISELHV